MIKVKKNACLLDATFVRVDLTTIHCAHFALSRLVMAKVRIARKSSKTRASFFIRGSKHRETDESTSPKAECFYCLEVFGTTDEKRSTSFCGGFSNSEFSVILSEE